MPSPDASEYQRDHQNGEVDCSPETSRGRSRNCGGRYRETIGLAHNGSATQQSRGTVHCSIPLCNVDPSRHGVHRSRIANADRIRSTGHSMTPSPERLCWRLWPGCQGRRQRCHSRDSSMGNHPNISGRMRKALFTQLHKKRRESKGTPSRPCSSPWDSTRLCKRPTVGCGQAKHSSRFWTTCISWCSLRGSETCIKLWSKSYADILGSESTRARLRCGIQQELDLKRVTRLRDLPGHPTQTHECGKGQDFSLRNTPLGHTDFVSVQLMEKLAEHEALLARIPLLQDLQAGWALLLHCAGGRANYLLRVVRPALVRECVEGLNTGLFNCLCRIMNIVPGQIHEVVKDIITMPPSIGAMGLRSAHRTSHRRTGQVGPTVYQ